MHPRAALEQSRLLSPVPPPWSWPACCALPEEAVTLLPGAEAPRVKITMLWGDLAKRREEGRKGELVQISAVGCSMLDGLCRSSLMTKITAQLVRDLSAAGKKSWKPLRGIPAGMFVVPHPAFCLIT